jgi:hypothetical protein
VTRDESDVSVWSLLDLGHVSRKKEKIKEEEIQIRKCMEGTQTEEGSKWLKNHKRRSEVRENKSSKEKIKEKKVAKRIYCGQVNKRNRMQMGALEHLGEKKKERFGEVLKRRVMWT